MAADNVTRRVLLTAGGLTLLAIVATDPSAHPAAAGHPTAAEPSPDAHPSPRRSSAPGSSAPRSSARGSSARGSRPAHTGQPRLAAARPGSPGSPGSRGSPGSPGSRGTGRAPLVSIDDGPTAIALTIDDGPSPVYTPQVLRLLARYRITATFSMIGIQAQAYPAVARDVAAAGHLIANHTWTHLNLQRLPPALVTEQMTRAADAIHAATGRVPSLFRAPYGAWSPFVLAQCARAGLTPLGWSVDPRDWSRPGVPSIVTNIMRNTHSGSIILEHDGGGNRAQTVAALSIIIPRLLAAGYHFRTP
jgi:peptidoglycan/xylan/chitin deacetylase (PgdA/CDA1 family)